jgi:cytosine/creatinine deaminase
VLGAGPQATAHAIAAELARFNQRCDPSQGQAALLGAFVYRNEYITEKLQRVFDLARQYNLHLDFHVDEGLDADACGLHAIAALTIHNQYQGKVTCGHACSLSVQPLAQARETLTLCAQAGIHLVALPSTNLYLQGAWETTPVERGITRLKEALALALPSSIATDNVADGFYPYGSYDLLDTFCLGVQVAHLSPAEAWLTHITTHPAQAMGLAWDGKIAVDCPADFMVLNARDGFELMTPWGRQRRVIRNGEFIGASTTLDTTQ